MAKLPVISMLEKVQYMERLELLDYQSNEILFLGDETVLQKMIEKAAVDSSNAWNKLRSISLELEKTKVQVADANQSQTLLEKGVDNNRQKVDSLNNTYKDLGDHFDHFLKTVKGTDSTTWTAKYGAPLTEALKVYEGYVGELHQKRGDTRKERREERKDERKNEKTHKENEKSALEDLEKAWVEAKKERFAKWNDARDNYDRTTRESNRSAGKRKIDHLNKNRAQLESEQQTYQRDLEVARSKIDQLMKTMTDSKNASEGTVGAKNARLLAVVPAKVSLSLNLENVQAHVTADSTVLIAFDSIQYDQVEVIVDSAQHYNIAQRRIELARQEGGLYFDLLQQIQIGVELIQHRVGEKARSADLKAKAHQKAVDYFKMMFNPIGFKVRVFEGEIPQPELAKVKTVHEVKKKPKQSKVVVPPVKRPVKKAVKQLPDTLRGIDVSHFNGDVNWPEVKASGISFSYAKATEGPGFNDPRFKENWANMKAAGVTRGAYHFYDPAAKPQLQADFFIKAVGSLEAGDMPPMLDLEGANIGGLSESQYQQNIMTWLAIVQEHFEVQPIIYTDAPFANAHLNNPEFAKYKLWIAEYTDADEPHLPNTWKSQGWYIWQHTARGDIKGIEGYVDEDLIIGQK
ncbi:GH25 family lysozyme [uncultured Roseivirga sp.]|uniref:GH25 family lysozyme n=1 Tax=uncultured Roseivirga sp. TaxID=543088 RepID=UPI002585892C|nr:GH25 family lysozyme [uncultured Roseivirga sp.]